MLLLPEQLSTSSPIGILLQSPSERTQVLCAQPEPWSGHRLAGDSADGNILHKAENGRRASGSRKVMLS